MLEAAKIAFREQDKIYTLDPFIYHEFEQLRQNLIALDNGRWDTSTMRGKMWEATELERKRHQKLTKWHSQDNTRRVNPFAFLEALILTMLILTVHLILGRMASTIGTSIQSFPTPFPVLMLILFLFRHGSNVLVHLASVTWLKRTPTQHLSSVHGQPPGHK